MYLIFEIVLKMKPTQQNQELRHIVRIANTDLNGEKPIGHMLTKIKGVSYMFSNLICRLALIDPTAKAGVLSETQIEKIENVITNPLKAGAPAWMLNRRYDPDDGADKHLISTNLTFVTDNDIKFMKKIKSYKGVRHIHGLPVRGQRTRSNFRKNKGKVMGVQKTKTAPKAE